MKYFTEEYLADWEHVRPGDETHLAYARHIALIRPKLPPDLQRLCDLTPGWAEHKIFLNDSNIQEVDCSFTEQRVTIVLNGEYTDAAGHQLGLRDFHLRYQQVTSFHSAESRPVGIGEMWGGFGDHLADEIDLVEKGLFEHRMLFSSGIELATVFRQFFLSHIDTPHKGTV